MNKLIAFSLAASLVGLLSSAHSAPLTYPGCNALQPSDFEIEKLTDLKSGMTWEPVKMALTTGAGGAVDVYFVELRDSKNAAAIGSIKVYRGSTKQTIKLISFPVVGDGNDGLSGIAIDPNFKTNGWIYVQYSIEQVFRLSRFTVKGDAINPASETIILDAPAPHSRIHTGGAMAFDEYGDLWWGVGENQAAEKGPSNSKDFKGKIVRIHPISTVPDGQRTNWGIGKTYTIPSGNFGEYFAAKYTAEGNATRAAEFKDTSKVQPEIFAMGARNPYTLTLDPVRRWVTWGDCGPDHGAETEEYNLTSVPGFFGYPYFAGNNWVRPDYTNKVPAIPVNSDATIKGIKILPPAVPAIFPYHQDCAMTGPIYRYNPKLVSASKMPPHFDRLWLVTDFNKDWIWGFKLNPEGTKIVDSVHFTDPGGLFANLKTSLKDPLDFQVGPDGALYILNYDGWYDSGPLTSIVRIKYKGTACAAGDAIVYEKAGCTVKTDANYDPSATHLNQAACVGISGNVGQFQMQVPNRIQISSNSMYINANGSFTVSFMGADGKVIATKELAGEKTYLFNELNLNQTMGFLFIKAQIHGYAEYHRVFLN